ncbi:MAG: caspase family protein [Bacteroidia bacterium]|nr:caspase family protein [Bacteroidia bacterium]
MRFNISTITAYFVALIAFAIGMSSLHAQSSWVPSKHYGIPSKDKHAIFYDDFDDNRNKWDVGSVYLVEHIGDGDYYCASRNDHTYTKRRPISMNNSGNYEVEMRIRFVKGASHRMTGLTFGRDVRGSEYNFFFNAQQQFRISKYDRGRTHDYQKWRYSKYLQKHAYNTLMIRKVADHWYFFINQNLVAHMPAKKLFGNEFGFTIDGHMAVEVDYLRVSEIKSIDHIGPDLTMIYPNVQDRATIRIADSKQRIEGKVYDVSGIKSVTINGHEISVDENGIFAASLKLPSKVVPIKIVAKDRFENITKKVFTLEYQPAVAELTNGPNAEGMSYGTAYENGVRQNRGKNYLLLIGVNQYQHWNTLHNAVKDCRDLADVLTRDYQFAPENVITLFNEEATRENILETFEQLQETISPDDNLLIYYAGHGFYDSYSQLGYWVPMEARQNKIPDFIRNSTIHDYLRTINTKHTFLIADACYAGSLFATASRGMLDDSHRSRWAFTSGDIEKVWDGQPGQNSPFASQLIRFLRNNRKDKLPANELIKSVGTVVQRMTAQTPQGSPLKQAGDDGGVFMFYRK